VHPCANERRPWSRASTASQTSTRCIPASTMKRYSSARIWMRFRALPDQSRGPDYVSHEQRGRALTEAVDLFPLRTSRCRETIQGVFGADPRVHKDGDGRATRQSCPGCMALKGGHQMPYKICATVHPDCRLPTRSSMADVTVTSIEGEQHGGAYAKLFADGSALRR
jgi:hypothetical protein